jgi:hypothetical protein
MFSAAVILKLVVYAVMWFGVYLGIRAVIDGRVGLGLVILFIGVPLALFVARLVLGVGQMIVLFPVALVTGRGASSWSSPTSSWPLPRAWGRTA